LAEVFTAKAQRTPSFLNRLGALRCFAVKLKRSENMPTSTPAGYPPPGWRWAQGAKRAG
jgi:hypothetical protein